MRRQAAILALAAACNLAPRYERPAAPIAGQFAADAGGGLAAVDRGWRGVFGDARLRRVIELALEHNRDLRVAVLNVAVTQAQFRIERAALLPTIGATAQLDMFGTTTVNARYRGGVGISQYELDLFGRVRNLKASALETYLATAEVQRAIHIALVAEVVTQYLRERAFAEQLAVAEQTVALVGESLAIAERLLDAGQRSELDVRTAEAQLHAARAEIHRLTRLRAQAEHALVVLVGRPLPADLPAAQSLAAQAIAADIPAGIPSEVLLRRPDVLAAEHALRAAHADIGVARAAFFPRLALTAFAGIASDFLLGVATPSFVWNVAPQLFAPLFTAGRNRAIVDSAQLRKEIQVARYEQAIQIAFREVADALIARATLDEQLAAQTARAEAEQARFRISEARYRNGIESYLTVIFAQQDLYQTEQQLIELRLLRLVNLAALYAALGGGWRED
jgi:outer membrane protein, multidrug efflux system